MTVKLSGKLPEMGTDNGLEPIRVQLIHQPDDPVFAVVMLKTIEDRRNYETGVRTPTIRVVRIEPLISPAYETRAQDLMNDAYGTRTGNDPLPFGMTVEVVKGGDSA